MISFHRINIGVEDKVYFIEDFYVYFMYCEAVTKHTNPFIIDEEIIYDFTLFESV